MSQIAFRNHSLEFFGSRYFLDNAQMVAIADYGEKAGIIGTIHKLEVKGHLPAPGLHGKIRVAGPFVLDTELSSKSDFTSTVSGSVKAVGFSGSVGAMYDALAQRHLKFIQLYVQENDMVTAVNNAPKARDRIHDYGVDGRIVFSTFVMADATFAESFTGGASWSVTADAAGIISVSASGGSSVSGKNTLKMADGTVTAYGLLKLEWSGRDDRFDGSHVDEPGLL